MFQSIKKFLSDNKYNLGLFFSLLFGASDAFAVFETAVDALKQISDGLSKVIYPAATIGISCVCIGGMFGNFNWKWLVAILLGVFITAYAASVSEVVTADMNGVE